MTATFEQFETPSPSALARQQVHNIAAVVSHPSDVFEIRILPVSQSIWSRADELPDQTDRLLAINDRRQNVYIGALPRTAKGKRGNENVALARVMFADFDHMTPGEAIERIEAAGMPTPTMSNFSGGGCQTYWKLAGAVDDLDLWEELQRDIIRAVGSDPACCNPERLMRLPGFRNWKYDPAPEARIVDLDPTARFAFDHLRGIVPKYQEQERQEQERQAVARKAAKLTSSRGTGESVIYSFKEAHDVESLLTHYGYRRGPKGRFVRPGGKSESVSVKDGRSCHHSSSDILFECKPAGCVCGVADAFDLFRMIEHGGDYTRAVRGAAQLMGMEANTTTTSEGDYTLVSHRRFA